MFSEETIADLISRYRLAAIGSDDRNPDIANRWHDEVHRCFKQLKKSPDGKQAILAMMSDSNPHIRCWAASHSLLWAPDAAKPVLRLLKESQGTCSFEAQMVLESFENGTLTFDY